MWRLRLRRRVQVRRTRASSTPARSPRRRVSATPRRPRSLRRATGPYRCQHSWTTTWSRFRTTSSSSLAATRSPPTGALHTRLPPCQALLSRQLSDRWIGHPRTRHRHSSAYRRPSLGLPHLGICHPDPAQTHGRGRTRAMITLQRPLSWGSVPSSRLLVSLPSLVLRACRHCRHFRASGFLVSGPTPGYRGPCILRAQISIDSSPPPLTPITSIDSLTISYYLYCITIFFSLFFLLPFFSLYLYFYSSFVSSLLESTIIKTQTNHLRTHLPCLYCLYYTYAHLSRILRSVLCHAPPLMYVSLPPLWLVLYCVVGCCSFVYTPTIDPVAGFYLNSRAEQWRKGTPPTKWKMGAKQI